MTIRAAVLCDECDAVFVPEARLGQGELSRAAHADGWTSINTAGQWRNICPDHDRTNT